VPHNRFRRIDSGPQKKRETEMSEVQKYNLKQAAGWLQGEVEIRIQKKWLVIGAAVIVALVVVAID